MRIQGRLVKKPSISEDFWSTSTYEMENSTIQSQRSLSSISVSNQVLSQNIGTGSTSNHSEFVNHGYLLWNQTRLQWLGSKKPENQRQVREPILNWNATYENLLGTNKRFPHPIPLSVSSLCNQSPTYAYVSIFSVSMISTSMSELIKMLRRRQEMVDFLVDIWEQEGLYD
nr:uncharacterized protein LOC109184044 isoform X1 [Ipomoea batatas]